MWEKKSWVEALLNIMKKPKVKCRWCGKTSSPIKYYIIADNLEEPKPYHPSCMKKFNLEVIKRLNEENL